jgi:hypothetical protein
MNNANGPGGKKGPSVDDGSRRELGGTRQKDLVGAQTVATGASHGLIPDRK